MVNVGTSIDDIGVDALTTILGVKVLVEATKGKTVTVRDTSQTPGGILLDGRVLKVVDLRVLLDVLDLPTIVIPRSASSSGWRECGEETL